MLILSIILLIFKHQLITIYIANPDIIEKGSECLILIAIAQIFDMYQTIYQGYFRGLGKHYIASIVCFSNFYFFTLGMAIIFGKLLKYNVIGIWFAYMLGIIFTGITYTIAETYFDYEELTIEAKDRGKEVIEMEEIIGVLKALNEDRLQL